LEKEELLDIYADILTSLDAMHAAGTPLMKL
jgi:hypothetical protein